MGTIVFGLSDAAAPVIEYTYQVTASGTAVYESTLLRDVFYSLFPAELTALDADSTLIVGISGPTAPIAVGVTEIYNRVNGDWNQLPIRLPPITVEDIQDLVGAMMTSGTQSGITVTYDDPLGRIDFSVP